MAAAAPKSDYRSLVEDAPIARANDSRGQLTAARALSSAAPQRAAESEEIGDAETLQRATLKRARREELHFDSDPDNLMPRTKRNRRRAQQHRPIRLTWPAVLCVMIVMAQLVLLLRMNARALEASQQAGELETKIVATSDQIERTQQRISVYDSSAHLSQWATERGWKQAGHLDIDDVTRAGLAAAMPTPDSKTKPDAYFIEGQNQTNNDGQVKTNER